MGDQFDMVLTGDIDGVESFLTNNPKSINTKNNDGDTLLHVAAWGKQLGILGVLLARGADVNAIGCYGRTPLHYAVHEGSAISVPLVGALIAQGADPSVKDDNGFTPRDWAKVEIQDSSLVEVLRDFDRADQSAR